MKLSKPAALQILARLSARGFSGGGTLTGIIHFIGAPMAIEIEARAGINFVIIDMEHSPLDMDRLAHLIRAADAAGIAPLVRVPDVEPGLIKRVLNLDATGLVIPHGTRARCEAPVHAERYAPDGVRGACPVVRATGYWPDDWNAYAQKANRDVFLLPLIEPRRFPGSIDCSSDRMTSLYPSTTPAPTSTIRQ